MLEFEFCLLSWSSTITLDGKMLFSTSKKRYALTVSVVFGFTVGFYLYSCRTSEAICSSFSFYSPFCTIITTGILILVAGSTIGALWRFLPNASRVYVSLLAISPGGFTFYILFTVLAYSETIKALWHIRELTLIPLTIADCLKNETIYSAQLIRNSSTFQDSHVNYVQTSVADIATDFNNVNGTQHQFRSAIEIGFKWLESKGLGCQQVITRPFEICLNASQVAKKDCHLKGAGSLCDIVNISESICKSLAILSQATCQDLGPEKITRLFKSLRGHLSNLVSGAIRMRVGILFELHSTSQVEKELNKAWNSALEILNNSSEMLVFLCQIFVGFVLNYLGTILIVIWPIYYLCYYLYGSLLFDNCYILKDELNQELVDRLTNEIQVIPTRPPTLKEVGSMICNLLLPIDQLVIIAVLLVDFFYTKWVNTINTRWMELFHYYENNLFDTIQQPNITGVKWIGQMIVEQLQNLQEAIGLGRLTACVGPAPPSNYSYNIFSLAMFQRVLYIFVYAKWRCLPSFICARFYRRRHRLRMRCLIARILSNPIK